MGHLYHGYVKLPEGKSCGVFGDDDFIPSGTIQTPSVWKIHGYQQCRQVSPPNCEALAGRWPAVKETRQFLGQVRTESRGFLRESGILSDSMEVGAKIPWNGSMFTARSEGFPVIFIPEVLRFWGVLVLRIKLLVILSKSRSLRFVSNLSLPRIYWIIQNSKSQTESHVISRFFPGGLKNHM